MNSQRRRVVVTGMGAVTPVGLDVESTWAALKDGVSGIGPTTLFETAGYRTTISGEVGDWDTEAYFERKDSRRLDRFSEFFIVASRQALAQSGLDYTEDDEGASRAGVMVGAGFGGDGLVHRRDQHSLRTRAWPGHADRCAQDHSQYGGRSGVH